MKRFESYSLENSLRLSSTSCREWVTVSLIYFILLWSSMYLLTVLITFLGKSEPQISSIDDSFSANVNQSSMFSVSVSMKRVVSVCKQISVCVWRCCIWYNLYPMCIFLPLLSCIYEGSENEWGARYFLLPVHACPLPHLDDTLVF